MSDISVKIKGDASGFQKEWAKVQGTVSNAVSGGGFGLATAASGILGGLTIGSAIGQIKAVVNELDNMADTANKIGMPVEEFQLLDYAAKKVGSTGESVAASFKKMNSAIYDAAHGNDTAGAAMYCLGLNAEELMKKTKPEQWKSVSDALMGIENETTRNALAQEMLGKSYQSTLQVMKELPQAAKEFEAMNLAYGEKAFKTAESLADAWMRLGVVYNKGLIGTGVLEEINTMTKAAEGLIIVLNKINAATNISDKAKGAIDIIQNNIIPGKGLYNAAVGYLGGKRDEAFSPGGTDSARNLSGAVQTAQNIGGEAVQATSGSALGGSNDLAQIRQILDSRLPGQTSVNEVQK
jgi:hypothetical protein